MFYRQKYTICTYRTLNLIYIICILHQIHSLVSTFYKETFRIIL